jgi:ribose 5-phosphate isomerase B
MGYNDSVNIYIASDHAGFDLKEFLMESLGEIGHTVVDCGAYIYNEADDYPAYISKAAKAVSEAEALCAAEDAAGNVAIEHDTRAIVIGGSGQGEAITANKLPHVRAALCYGGERAEEIVRLSREHNNANVLSLGARFLSEDQTLELVLLWLNTKFSGDARHVRRLHEIEDIQYEPLYEL